jgi:hypothetical protein
VVVQEYNSKCPNISGFECFFLVELLYLRFFLPTKMEKFFGADFVGSYGNQLS